MDGFGLTDLLPFIAVGFAAQLVDGALGMAFGVISSTLLLSLGVPPAAASAGVHTVETFTTGISGLSHILHRNVDWKLFARLAIPGVIGGVCGAYLLSNIDAGVARPFVMAYLAIIGVYLIWRGFHLAGEHKAAKIVEPLGLAGGFLDAAGGGGWGPVVTGNLLVQGHEPRKTIGTVSASEFVLTLTISATFIANLGWEAFTEATLGLLIGGVIAAPLGAFVVKKAPGKALLIFVGCLLTLTSLYGVYKALA
ncbi:sulfite exporter TauE/SafE family protein [Sphingosinicella sp. BN140058]|uniref:sulfite exporter TauE/SafE family protein n=1 Tax=Sphingosinicella sp. BN140058 TaxID=1892855 RepID=UPI0010124ADD|nr:sulfite exporter TauE/SafE family protein [Sphingosinicella sp. BN140058]QAY75544.1 sulfite exporter TauE/SafE family protein [Sphingosinicella sp. BN140058]